MKLNGPGQESRYARLVRRLLAERQVFVRSGDRVVYKRVSRRFQLACLAVAAVIGGWVAFASTSFFAADGVIRAKDEQIAQANQLYRNLLNDVADYQNRSTILTRELEKNHAMMLDLVENNARLQLSLKNVQSNLDSSKSAQAEILNQKNTLRDKLSSIEGELNGLNTRNFELRSSLNTTTSDLETAVAERNQAQSSNGQLRTQIAQLEGEVAKLHQTETYIVGKLAKRTQDGITKMENIFAKAGLKTDEFLNALETASNAPAFEEEADPSEDSYQAADGTPGEEQAAETDPSEELGTSAQLANAQSGTEMPIHRAPGTAGQGGPFIAVKPQPSSSERGEILKAKLDSLEERLNRWDDLRQLMRIAPLPSPLDKFELSSGFGKRHDPINNRWSMHYGVDLRGPTGSPVMATAPGVVIFAGTDSGYGRNVEIDHGMGFKTRYGHLEKILVQAGQKVDTQTKIGLLGSSGRSTGPHLHYEIVHNGKPIDPMRFLQAGKYVYRQK